MSSADHRLIKKGLLVLHESHMLREVNGSREHPSSLPILYKILVTAQAGNETKGGK